MDEEKYQFLKKIKFCLEKRAISKAFGRLPGGTSAATQRFSRSSAALQEGV
jgi:hypothetical protein